MLTEGDAKVLTEGDMNNHTPRRIAGFAFVLVIAAVVFVATFSFARGDAHMLQLQEQVLQLQEKELLNKDVKIPKYYFGELGSDTCGGITTVDDCHDAIRSLGLTVKKTWNGNYNAVPAGCSIIQATNYAHWNKASIGKGRKDLTPVCKVAGVAPQGFGPPAGKDLSLDDYDYGTANKVLNWFKSVLEVAGNNDDKTVASKLNYEFTKKEEIDTAMKNLKDGIILLRVANIVWRKDVGRTKRLLPGGRMFDEWENIDNFLAISSSIGINDVDIFTPTSLWEATDLKSVVNGMDQFARKTIKMILVGIPTYAGPVEADDNAPETKRW